MYVRNSISAQKGTGGYKILISICFDLAVKRIVLNLHSNGC